MDDELKTIIELAGVVEDELGCEAGVSDEVADFWSVYVRKPDERGDRLAECVADHMSKGAAVLHANKLVAELAAELNDRTWSEKCNSN